MYKYCTIESVLLLVHCLLRTLQQNLALFICPIYWVLCCLINLYAVVVSLYIFSYFTFDVNWCGELVLVCVKLHCNGSGTDMKQSRLVSVCGDDMHTWAPDTHLPSSLQHPKTILISEVEEEQVSHLPAKIRKLEQDEEVCVVGYFESFAVCLSSHTASLPSVRQFKGVLVLILILRPLALQAMSATGYRLKIVGDRRTVRKQHFLMQHC